ncbi:MAG: type II toxin-antitoxin system HicA family toxin [Pyrinomonadaceae bacterium]
MPNLAPIKRKDLIYYFRQLGFDCPYSGGNHQYMKKDTLKVRLPNPHQSEIRRDFLVRIFSFVF